MNKNSYKLVFNKVRGMLMAVIETASSHSNAPNQGQKSSGSSSASAHSEYGVRQLVAATLLALFTIQDTLAQSVNMAITPDLQQQGAKPIVGVAGNGVPIVHITPPTRSGVSMNQFEQYNVPTQGLIINNSGGMVQTQLGGYIPGNPMLGNQAATTVVNQVTGAAGVNGVNGSNIGNRTQILGAQEIAGQRANLVIANPNGIVVNGGALINVNNATLTTGQVQLGANGQLSGVNVQKGQIVFEGVGLNAKGNKLNILTQAATLNANVWAQQSNTVLGVNQIDVTADGDITNVNAQNQTQNTTNAATNTTNTTTDTTPQFALDVSQLGGMYANQISLIGTQKGLGVNHGGKLIASDSMTLDINGDLVNTGSIGAGNHGTIQTLNINNSGELSALNQLTLQTQNNITNTRKIIGGSIQASGVSLNNSGQIVVSSKPNVTMTTGDFSNVGGRLGLSPTVAPTVAPTPAPTAEATSEPTPTINPTTAPTTNTGTIEGETVVGTKVADPATLSDARFDFSQTINNDLGAIEFQGDLAINSRSFDNSKGMVQTDGQQSIQSNVINNTQGQLASQSLIDLKASQITNDQGSIKGQKVNIWADRLSNRDTSNDQFDALSGETAVTLQSSSVTRPNETDAETEIETNSDTTAPTAAPQPLVIPPLIQNQGIQATTLNLNIAGELDNTSGKINADHLQANTERLTNIKGHISSAGDIELSKWIDNTGGVIQGQNIDIDSADTIRNAGGGLFAEQNINLNTNLSSATIETTIGTAVDNTQGIISAKGAIEIQGSSPFGAQVLNNDGYIRGDQVSIHSTSIFNQNNHLATRGAGIIATKQVNLATDTLDNRGNVIAGDAVEIKANASGAATELSNQKGLINGQNNVAINASNLHNQEGEISSVAGAININAQGSIDNTTGRILGAHQIGLTSKVLTNKDMGLIQGDQVKITANQIHNQNTLDAAKLAGIVGITSADVTLDNLSSSQIDNSHGFISGQQQLTLQNAKDINNTQGVIATKGDLNLSLQNLNNQAGQIAADNITIQAIDQINNQQGRLAATHDVRLTAREIANQKGVITAGIEDADGKVVTQGNIDLNATDAIFNNDGVLSGQNINIQSQTLDNSSTAAEGEPATGIFAKDQLDVSAQSVINEGGNMIAEGLNLIANLFNNQKGKVDATDIDLSSKTILNQQGRIVARRENVLTTDALDNTDGVIGTIDPEGRTTINAADAVTNAVTNTRGNIQSDHVMINSQALDNQSGRIIGKQTLDIDAARINNQSGVINGAQATITSVGINNLGGEISASQHLAITSQTLNNGQKGLIDSRGTATLDIANLNNQAGAIQTADHLELLTQELGNSSGRIHTGSLTLDTKGELINNQGGLIYAQGKSNITANSISNTSGEISTKDGDLTLQVNQTLDNSSGYILGSKAVQLNATTIINQDKGLVQGHDLTLTAQTVNNQNTLNTDPAVTTPSGIIGNTTTINASNTLDNRSGFIRGDQGLVLNTPNMLNTKGVLATQTDFVLNAQNIDNAQGSIYAKSITMTAADQINNQQGRLSATHDVALTAHDINNQSALITAGTVDAAGNVVEQGNINLKADGKILNQDGTLSGTDVTVQAVQFDNSSAVDHSDPASKTIPPTGILAKGHVDIQTDQTDNTNSNIVGQTVTTHGNQLMNQKGNISANSIDLHQQSLQNQTGRIVAEALAELNALDVNNNGGIIGVVDAQGQLTVNSGKLDNTSGTIKADQTQLNLTGQLTNDQQGLIVANDLAIAAGSISNHGGIIKGQTTQITSQNDIDNGQGSISGVRNLGITAKTLLNQQGEIYAGDQNSKGQLKLTTDTLNNDTGLIAGKDIVIDAQTLSNQQSGNQQSGKNQGVLADDHLNLNAQSLNNTSGVISAVTSQINTSDLINQKGLISASDNTITSTILDNTQGEIHGNNSNTIQATQTLINSQGRITSNQHLAITSNQLNNSQGAIDADQAHLSISGQVNNQGGLIRANDLTIAATNIDNSFTYLPNVPANAQTPTVPKAPTGIMGLERLNVTSANQLNNTQGLIVTSNGQITAQTLDNQKGLVLSLASEQPADGSDRTLNQLDINVTTLNNTQGQITGDRLNITSQTLNNQDTQAVRVDTLSGATTHTQGIQAADLTINTTNLNNQIGYINSFDAQINAKNTDNTQGIINGAYLTMTSPMLNNQDGQITAQGDLTLTTDAFTNQGTIKGELNTTLNVKGDYVNDGTTATNGSLTINSQGNITNTDGSSLTAVDALHLSAQNINNGQDALINSANTVLDAKGTVTNKGTIDGAINEIRADKLINDGKIYGGTFGQKDGLIIGVNALNNQDTAAIVSRSQMLLGATEINNGKDALIQTLGDLSLGAKVDANYKVTGDVTTLNNRSGTIEVGGNALWHVGQTNNINTEFKADTWVEQAPQRVVTYIIGNKQYDATEVAYVGTNGNGVGGIDFEEIFSPYMLDNAAEAGDGNTRMVAQSEKFPIQLFGPLPPTGGTAKNLGVYPWAKGSVTLLDMSWFDVRTGKTNTDFSIANSRATGATTNHNYERALAYAQGTKSTFPVQINTSYTPNDPIWALFGITPPTSSVEPTVSSASDIATWLKWAETDLKQFVELDRKMDEFIGDLLPRIHSDWTFSDLMVTHKEQTITQSRPAQIIVGGDMTLNGKLNNDKSTLIVGNRLVGDAKSITNTGANLGIEESTSSGESKYTWNPKGSVRKTSIATINAFTTTSLVNRPIYNFQTNAGLQQVASIGLQASTSTTPIITSPVDAVSKAIYSSSSGSATAPITANPSTAGSTDPAIDPNGANPIVDPNAGQNLLTATAQVTEQAITAANGNSQTPIVDATATPSDIASQTATADPSTAGQPTNASAKPVAPPARETRTIAFNGILPTNQIFNISTKPNAAYIIETDPQLTNKRQFLSSDFMLQQIASSPDATWQRLGDGWYEQKLINDQIMAMTAKRFTGDYTSNEEQYKALMTNGLAFGKTFNLQVGTALTPEQMALLTTDMVWLVWSDITLPDGSKRKVLTPQVYLATLQSDLKGDGTLISAKSNELKVGVFADKPISMSLSEFNDLLATGQLGSTDNGKVGTAVVTDASGQTTLRVDIDGGGAIGLPGFFGNDPTAKITLDNMYVGGVKNDGAGFYGTSNMAITGGSVINNNATVGGNAGGTVNFDLTGRYTSSGTDLRGGKVHVAADGIDMSTTVSTNSSGTPTKPNSSYQTSTQVDRFDTVQTFDGDRSFTTAEGKTVNIPSFSLLSRDKASGDLRDINLTAVQAELAGSSQTHGDRIVYGTVDTSNELSIVWDPKNHLKMSETEQITTNFSSQGDQKNFAKSHLQFDGSQLFSENGKVTNAVEKGNIVLNDARKTSEFDQAHYDKDKGLFNTTTTSTKDHISKDEAIKTTVSADSADFEAKNGKVIINGADIVTDNSLYIKGTEGIEISAPTNTYSESHEDQSKTSGIRLSGDGLKIGSESSLDQTARNQTFAVPSNITSLNGNVTLVTDQTLNIDGSNVFAPKGLVNIDTGKVVLDGVEQKDHQLIHHKDKTTGLNTTIGSPVLDTVKAIVDMSENIGQTDDPRVKAMAAAAAAAKAQKLANDIAKAAAQNPTAPSSIAIVELKAQLGTETNSSTSTTDVTSTAASSIIGQQVQINVHGLGKESDFILGDGAKVYGTQSTKVTVEDQIIFETGQTTTVTNSTNKSDSNSISGSVGFGPGVPVYGFGVDHRQNDGQSTSTHVQNDLAQLGTGMAGSKTDVTAREAIGPGRINGDRVEFDFKVLDLTSPQDTYTYSGTTNASNIGISGGTSGPPSLTLGGSHSNLDGRYASTTQTAGIYAGDLGFKGRVGDTSLTGAVITSTEAAEQLGRNSLVTDHLQLNDVTNFETLKGSTGGMDLTISPAPSGSKIPFIPTGYGLGFGNIDESNSGVTKSGINTTNLTVTDPQGQMQGLTPQQIIDLTKTHVTTDNVDTNNNGQLDLTINPAAAQASLDMQLSVTKAFTSEAVPAAISKVNGKIDTLKDERKIAEANHDFDRVKQLDQQITNWQKGAVLINSLSAALANPIGGLAGAAGAALSPVLSYEIGQVFKQGIDVNGKPYGEGSLPHILAHLVAGALSAVISGSGTPIDTTQIITQAASAAGAEALTPYIAKLLYADATNADNFKVSDLTADQKAVITNIAHLIGTGVGAAVTGAAGGDFGQIVTNAVVGEQSAGAAVDNNILSLKGLSQYRALLIKFRKEGPTAENKAEENRIEAANRTNTLFLNTIYDKATRKEHLTAEEMSWVERFAQNNSDSSSGQLGLTYPDLWVQQEMLAAQQDYVNGLIGTHDYEAYVYNVTNLYGSDAQISKLNIVNSWYKNQDNTSKSPWQIIAETGTLDRYGGLGVGSANTAGGINGKTPNNTDTPATAAPETPKAGTPINNRPTILENVTGSKTRIEAVPNGNRAMADADFDSLGLKNVKPMTSPHRGDGRRGELPNGDMVIVRPSADGRPTIEFQTNGRKTREVRYGSK